MALITCPECGKRMSDKASACPNCGAPIQPKMTYPNGGSANTPAHDVEQPSKSTKRNGQRA